MEKHLNSIQQYHRQIELASNESAKRECFKTLLVRLFDSEPVLSDMLDKMSLGAEKQILCIPQPTRTKTGYADTQYGNVIIEFEKDLRKTGKHAEEQLVEYLAGNWRSGDDYNFTLIATDGVKWRILAPNYEKLIALDRDLQIADISLAIVIDFDLNSRNHEEFYYFLDRFLFKTETQRATLENIALDFGDSSPVFFTSMITMRKVIPSIEALPILETAYAEWKTFLSDAYGRFDDSKEIFFVHTYLSVFAKLIAYRYLSKEYIVDKGEIHSVLTGKAFSQHNVDRFVENDFYFWITDDEFFSKFLPIFRLINQKLSVYDFADVREDVLKGIYQDLIDIDTRHALGEYYTPDWLCEKIVATLPIEKSSTILDPACGSGSFLRAAIARLRELYPDITASKLTAQVVGIDIHPLSVQIAKTTVLLALGDTLTKARIPVTLNVHLANSLILPSGDAELFPHSYKVRIDRRRYPLELSIFKQDNEFDVAISLCDHLASLKDKLFSRSEFQERIKVASPAVDEKHGANFYDIYRALKRAKEAGRDSIWRFILQNLYKPTLLRGQFDFVIGNPPWLTYSDIVNTDYQNDVRTLAERYILIPESRANMPHLEIAAIFLSHSAIHYAKPSGEIAFVLPRSFISADQHDNTRKAKAVGFRLKTIWDLNDVHPLFNVPSCVFFAKVDRKVTAEGRSIPPEGIDGLILKGKLPAFNIHQDKAFEFIQSQEVKWYYSTLSRARGARSALTTTSVQNGNHQSYYASKFRQGATIVPRCFYFVTVDQITPDDLKDRILNCKSTKLPEAKEPWKSITMRGRIHSNYLFRTALSKNIVPFALFEPVLVLLPIVIKGNDQTGKSIQLLDSDALLRLGDIYTSEWMRTAESLWAKHRTQRNSDQKMPLYEYLNWQNKLTDQHLTGKYLLVYTASAKNANAAAFDRGSLDMEFIAESKEYWFATNDQNEADYLACVINSDYANLTIKDFQSRGLFGPRDVHKSILGIPFPQFNPKDGRHQQLAELGRICAVKTQALLIPHKGSDLEGPLLGRIRTQIRSMLTEEFAAIDQLLIEILKD